ncbi:hypothetical protein ES705_29045 [subsurface metagenome]
MQENKKIVLRVEDIHKRYGTEEILKGVSFEISNSSQEGY